MILKGTTTARVILHANILLAADENITSRRKKRSTPPVPAKITGDVEARIVALSCSEPPQGLGSAPYGSR